MRKSVGESSRIHRCYQPILIQMQILKSDSLNGFSSQIFAQTRPACLRQEEWLTDTQFLVELKDSWVQQYSDYIGHEQAMALINQLDRDGSLYEHDPKFTLQAWVEDRRVGICALRQLGKHRELALITMLEVGKNHQNLGIGRQMVQALESASEHLMAHVSVHRPHIKVFYEKLGFSTLERSVVDHYGHELLFDVMAKRSLNGFAS